MQDQGGSLVNYQQITSAGLIDTCQYNTRKKNITWDKDNPLVQSGNASSLPSQRIDYIFLNQNARNILEPKKTRIVLTEKYVKTPSQTDIPLSDHYGVMTTFEYE